MHCYFNLVSSHQTIIDNEGVEVADLDEARTFARAAVSEMIQDGVAEIAHWRGGEIEARDGSGTVLFTVGFDGLLTGGAGGDEVQAVAEVSSNEDSVYAYNQAA